MSTENLREIVKRRKEEAKQKVIALYKEGYSRVDISNAVGIPLSTVRVWVKDQQ